ncbi:YbjN domain-containing protein [Novosphingobium piscinae]|nr:YbjN domain-containing protein [Novosphingobium piscinae]
MGVAVLAAGLAAPVAAATDCPTALICAANPRGIVDSLQAQGFKAVLGKSDNTGNPKITSSASGYAYTIFFYGCDKGANCTSLGFSVNFEDDGANSLALANEWNKDKRFSAMSFDESDKSLMLTYDVTTIGGLTQVNFADVVDWWQTMLGQARTFFDAHPAPKR